jgi:allophanate hydrolase
VLSALEKGREYDAEQTFAAQYRLRELQRETHRLLQGHAALIVPTYGRLPTLEEVADDPQQVNTRMGRYTYFANPLQLSGISVPVGLRDDGLPFGVSLLGLPFHELRLRDLAAALQRQAGGPLGATAIQQPGPAGR